jgi:4-hydroxy-L-threonine phosphate dehydrogenase PdxA
MMMFSKKYRVLLVTTHVPVSSVTSLINEKNIYNTIITGSAAISSIDRSEIKIAVAGLDPHCGDDGAIGDFDKNVTRKAVESARADGINAEGPLSADTLFIPGKWKTYNLAIAQYHDQGLIPFKMLAFDRGVNVTLGLSLVRTSVDHGTAFDIAGSGRASHMSMIEAVKLACKLRKNRDRPVS